MPGNFYRPPPSESINPVDHEIPDDSSWDLVEEADFIVYDHERGLEILGSNPTSQFMFEIKLLFYDATVYDLYTREVYFAELSGGEISQKVIDLDNVSSGITRKQANPPLYSPTGGIYRNGLFYFCVGGHSETVETARGTTARQASIP